MALAHPPLSASGKFVTAAGERVLIKGVTYGTFPPDADGACFPPLGEIRRDFDLIAALGANTIRTYTPPTPALLDEAAHRGLYVFAGVPWPQHVAFLETRQSASAIRRGVAAEVRALARHPATLLVAVGNEIPPSVIRWYGRRRIERFLHELHDTAKSAAPETLLTYVNYPPTEYLDTSGFDVCAFNLFLHDEKALRRYLARLHNVAGPRPLLIAELGADSLRHGEVAQASLVSTQLRTVLAEGVCGAVVFAWTDQWWRGGRMVDDWALGLVDAERRPKLAYHAVRRLFTAPSQDWQGSELPSVTVVVCAYNAGSTIGECLDSLAQLTYPHVEILVVDDGSTDQTADVAASRAGVRVISTSNAGLAAARNIGLHHARGEVVAYTDADVRVDREWLTHLVRAFSTPNVVAAGGPNVVPPDDPWFAHAVAHAPGGPTHVLLDDEVAEHVPGCNCAFRRETLVAIGGFNPIFRRAGDDVDVCWRIQARGGIIAYAPAALVWHRHRASTRSYLRQQVGYGEGETWLMGVHPRKFAGGRASWRGHIYSPLPFIRSLSSTRVNAGPFGASLFPSVYRTEAHPFAYLPHSGRWQTAWMVLLLASVALALSGSPYALACLLAGSASLLVTVAKCLYYAWRSDVSRLPPIGRLPKSVGQLAYRLSIAWLHFLQPFARLYGRLRGAIARPGLEVARDLSAEAERPASGWSWRSLADGARLAAGLPVERRFWAGSWIDPSGLLVGAAEHLRQLRAVRHIEIDSGWWEDRDVTLVDRDWRRFDLRALAEDHGLDGCMHRCALRWRSSAAHALGVAATAAMAAAVLRGAGLGWAAGAALGCLVACAATSVRAAGSLQLVVQALDVVAARAGLLPLDAGASSATSASVGDRSAGSETVTAARVEPVAAAPMLKASPTGIPSGPMARSFASGRHRSAQREL